MAVTACGIRSDTPTPDPSPTLPSGRLPASTLAIDVSVSPDCARPGSPITTTATTVAGARVTFIATYPGRSGDPDTTTETASRAGRARWRWTIPDPVERVLLVVESARETKTGTYVLPIALC